MRILIVGDNGVGYAGHRDNEVPLKQRMLKELEGQLDLERVHFLGQIPYPTLLALLRASWVHVYLTKPFILGWSLLEAMACGCALVGSEGMPVSKCSRIVATHFWFQGVILLQLLHPSWICCRTRHFACSWDGRLARMQWPGIRCDVASFSELV